MRSFIAVALLVAAVASAQSLTDLPTCAQGCIATGISSTTCSLTDIPCLCKDTKFQGVIVACVAGACNADEQAKAAAFSTSSCAGAGVPVNVSAAASSASSAASSAAASATHNHSAMTMSASSAASAAATASAKNGAGKLANGGILAAVGVVAALLL